MVVSRILSGTSHPQPVALLLWKNYANLRTGSLPLLGGRPHTLKERCADLDAVSGRATQSASLISFHAEISFLLLINPVTKEGSHYGNRGKTGDRTHHQCEP